jgi:hypothetical protein
LDELLPLKFSHRFEGQIWTTIASADGDVMLVEVRNADKKEVSFSALKLQDNAFLWRDKKLEESWWINASAISSGFVLFTIYLDTNNPDKKGVLSYRLDDLSLVWWNNDFSISDIGSDFVSGFSSKTGIKAVTLDIQTGKEIAEAQKYDDPNHHITRPVQYVEGMDYFATVKTFLADRLNLFCVSALEYVQAFDKIFISYYVEEEKGLANYLLVLSSTGDVVMKTKMDGGLKGIGLDTFFILNGLLIFVKNKVELVSYKIL